MHSQTSVLILESLRCAFPYILTKINCRTHVTSHLFDQPCWIFEVLPCSLYPPRSFRLLLKGVLVQKAYFSNVKMELMMCGGLLTITYENSAESIPLLLFGQSKGPRKIALNYVQLRQGRCCQSNANFPPSLHSYGETALSHSRSFLLWGEERANMILCTRCVTMEKTCISISLSFFLSLTRCVTCWLSRRSFPVRAEVCQTQRQVSGEHALRPSKSRFGNECHSGAKQLLSSRQAKPILSFWIMIMQNSVTRITGDESLSLSLSSHPTRGDSLLCNHFFPASLSLWQKRQ